MGPGHLRPGLGTGPHLWAKGGLRPPQEPHLLRQTHSPQGHCPGAGPPTARQCPGHTPVMGAALPAEGPACAKCWGCCTGPRRGTSELQTGVGEGLRLHPGPHTGLPGANLGWAWCGTQGGRDGTRRAAPGPWLLLRACPSARRAALHSADEGAVGRPVAGLGSAKSLGYGSATGRGHLSRGQRLDAQGSPTARVDGAARNSYVFK